ncbi:helix-turn-helix domain-containing protein [Pedobacter westerhofensis]|nr:AraC family transcriptional regulator [Pedobacter westerhofensis]
MKSYIRIRKGSNLIEDLSTEFYNVSTSDAVNLPSSLGSGKIRGLYFPSDLSLYLGKYHLIVPWQQETINEKDSTTFCISASIMSNEISIKKDGEWLKTNYNGPNSVLFYSYGSSVEVAYPQNEPLKTITITFTSATVSAIMDQPDVLNGLDPISPFLYLDEAVPEAETLIRKLACIGGESEPSKFEIYLAVLNLLRLTLYRSFVIKERYNSSGLLKEDAEKMFAIRKKLMENSHQTIKIAELAAEVGMGQSKMTRLFKQVFNRTLYQFAQKAKVIKAKDLLNSRNYNVSQAGYMVGYTNMTHFAKAFKKYYKVNPGDYLKRVLGDKISS